MSLCAYYIISNTFSLHQEQALAIKSRLQNSRKGSPDLKIVMDFDKTVYESEYVLMIYFSCLSPF